VTLSADIAFEGTGGDPHRKACLLIRQSLDADSAYADAALHGDGLTSLQYREAKGERTYEIQSAVSAPKRLRIEKRGRYVSMSIAGAHGALQPAGGAFRLDLAEPFYIGLGVCAHNDEVVEKAVFTNVEVIPARPCRQASPGLSVHVGNGEARFEGPSRRLEHDRFDRSAELDARRRIAHL
jgi:hypothetical protein